MRRARLVVAAAAAAAMAAMPAMPAWAPALSAAAGEGLAFEDVTDKVGLGGRLKDWTFGHAAAWGDADGDGRPDLYIGAFADREVPYGRPGAPIPNMLLLNRPEGFSLSPQKELRLDGLRARTSSAIFADLTGDGLLDLIVGNHASNAGKHPSVAFENTGGGAFRAVQPKGWPQPHATRNLAVCDFNRDGLLDLVLVDGNYAHWSTGGGKLTILENRGGWSFEDVTARYGLPDRGTVGMGLAIGDVNDDGRLDFFVADCNRLFISDPDGRYRECQPGFFIKAPPKNSTGHTCGAAFGDLDGDGLLDLVTTEHARPSRMHVYLNAGIRDGMPRFINATADVGLDVEVPATGKTGLPVKQAHVQVVDLDNDGRSDILTTMVRQGPDGRLQPVALRNLAPAGKPRFALPPPTELVGYYAPGPIADFDGDGRVDVFLPTWGKFRREDAPGLDLPSCLFRNISAGGHWLSVRVVGKAKGFGAQGVGATVRVYKAGSAGEPAGLIARRDIVVGTGYSSGEQALAYVGLGGAAACDVVVDWQGRRRKVLGAPADKPLTVVFD